MVSTKELITFVTAATFASLLLVVSESADSADGSLLRSVRWQTWTLGFCVLLLTVRFFYGNMRYVDCHLDTPPPTHRDTISTVLTVGNIIADSLILALASFYIERVG